MSDKRTFKIKDKNGETYGHFTGKTPSQAASKAFNSILKNGSKKTSFNFNIVESTSGSNQKEFSYHGKREKLDKPVELQIGGKTIVKKYKNKITANK